MSNRSFISVMGKSVAFLELFHFLLQCEFLCLGPLSIATKRYANILHRTKCSFMKKKVQYQGRFESFVPGLKQSRLGPS